MDEFKEIPPNHLFLAVTGELLGRRAGVNDPSVAIQEGDAVVRLFRQGAVARLFLPHPGFQGALLGA